MIDTIDKSIIAGFLIGIGVIINTIATIPFLGALLFSFGLLVIIQLQLPLYTGKIGFLGKNLFKILIFNFFGIGMCLLFYCTASPTFIPLITAAAAAKFSKTIIQMLLYGFFCGTLIHFAVRAKQPYITSMAVIIFILIGAEHCIAAFPFLLFCFNWTNLIKFGMIVLGNSLGAIFIEKMTKGRLTDNEVCRNKQE
jgi:formate/nitrite transporter FocA (FNT family)